MVRRPEAGSGHRALPDLALPGSPRRRRCSTRARAWPASLRPSAMPIATDSPWPSEPVAASMPGRATRSGWPWSGLPSLRSVTRRSMGKKPAFAMQKYWAGTQWPFDSTKRSRSSQSGSPGVVAQAVEVQHGQEIDHGQRAARVTGAGMRQHPQDLDPALARDALESGDVGIRHQSHPSMNRRRSRPRAPRSPRAPARTRPRRPPTPSCP